MLPAGILRETVTIQAATETRNEFGESVQDWQDVVSRRASVEAISYSEQSRRAQVAGVVSYTVRLRYTAGLTGAMRLRWDSRDGRILYISSVVERGNREEHELTCEEQLS